MVLSVLQYGACICPRRRFLTHEMVRIETHQNNQRPKIWEGCWDRSKKPGVNEQKMPLHCENQTDQRERLEEAEELVQVHDELSVAVE
jgi:hypothetical protein